MSRSKKKPYITDQNCSKPAHGAQKRKANRKVRAAGKKACKGDLRADTADGKAYRKESESWDIRDWSFHCPKDKKAYRK